MNTSRPAKIFSLVVLVSLFLVVLTGCSKGADISKPNALAMASMDDMPAEVKEAPTIVGQAYQFAAANPEILKQIPCYCGCDDIGHTSNYDCYVSNLDADGKLNYDSHALGCSICVDITQDTMRLLQQGKSVSEIKLTIDQTYSQYGPSNLP